MSNPDEFEYGDDLAPGPGPAIVACVVLVVFLAAVFGTALTDTFFPVEGLQLIGAELAEQEELAAGAELWDGSLARRFEDSLREHSRVRSVVLPGYAYLKFAFLDEAPTGIVVGKHHWLFLEKRITLSEWDDQFLADCFGTSMTALERRLLGNGIELVTLPLVRKAYVGRDYLPSGYDPRLAVDDMLIEGLKARGMIIADVRDAYARYRPDEIYYELDTHWTPNGARIAAEAMARAAGTLAPEDERLGGLQVEELQDRKGFGVGLLQSVNLELGDFDLDLLDLRTPQATVLGFDPELRKRRKRGAPESPDALAGTSFSTAQQFADLLTHYSGAPVFDGAVAARPYMMNVSRVLERYGDSGKLERLYFETPIAPPFIKFNRAGAYYTEAVGRTFVAAPPAKLVTLVPGGEDWMRFELGNDTLLDGKARTLLLALPHGVLAHTGDGVASFRLAGEVQGGKARLRISCGQSTYLVDVDAGSFEFTLPIIAPGPTVTGPHIIVDRNSKVRLRLDRVDVVHQPVGKRLAMLDVTERAGVITCTPRRPARLGRRAALIVKVAADSQRVGEVVVRVKTDAKGAARECHFETLVAGGSVVIDLGAAAGEELIEAVVVVGAGRLTVETAGLSGVE